MPSDGSSSAFDRLLEDPSQLGRDALEEHAQALWALLRIADAVHRANDFNELVEHAVEAIAKYTHYPSVALFRLDRAEGVLHLLASRGFNEEARERARKLPVAGSLTGIAVTQRTVVSTFDLNRDARLEPATRKALAADGFCEAASVPLFQGNEVIGALNLIYRHRAGLTENELRILLALGQTIGMAMSARVAAEERARLEIQARRAQQIESLGIFAGGVAHDFNNILTGVLGNISLVQAMVQRKDLPEAEPLLDEAERACRRAAELVKQLLTFSRGGAPLKRPTRDFPTLVEEAARFATTGSAVALDFRSQPIEGTLQIDPGQIMQVVHNLVLNAVQASAPGSSVTVSVAPKPAPAGLQAELVVEDHGSGIAPEHLAHVFEPYFTTRAGGSGLGLATTHSIVQRHDGQLSVHSVVGRGTRITVTLPITPVEIESSATAAPPPLRSLAGLRVLVLDDEPLISRLLSRLLQGAGVVATLTERGEDTVEVFRDAAENGRPFDLVILDLTVVGGLGGRETLARLREIDPEVRALASSGYSEDDVLAKPESYGFSAILPKPYTQRALVEALVAALGAGGA